MFFYNLQRFPESQWTCLGMINPSYSINVPKFLLIRARVRLKGRIHFPSKALGQSTTPLQIVNARAWGYGVSWAMWNQDQSHPQMLGVFSATPWSGRDWIKVTYMQDMCPNFHLYWEQELKKSKGIKFKTKPFHQFRKNMVEMFGLEQNKIRFLTSFPCFSSPVVWILLLTRYFCPFALLVHACVTYITF